MKKDYKVLITATTTHEYLVEEVNSQEEAESIAEDWFAMDDEGNVVEEDIDNIDSYPVEDNEGE